MPTEVLHQLRSPKQTGGLMNTIRHHSACSPVGLPAPHLGVQCIPLTREQRNYTQVCWHQSFMDLLLLMRQGAHLLGAEPVVLPTMGLVISLASCFKVPTLLASETQETLKVGLFLLSS